MAFVWCRVFSHGFGPIASCAMAFSGPAGVDSIAVSSRGCAFICVRTLVAQAHPTQGFEAQGRLEGSIKAAIG